MADDALTVAQLREELSKYPDDVFVLLERIEWEGQGESLREVRRVTRWAVSVRAQGEGDERTPVIEPEC